MTEHIIAGSTGLLFGYPATRTSSTDPRDWKPALGLLHSFGFEAVDLSEMWTSPTALDDAATDDLGAVLDEIGMPAAGLSLISIDFSAGARAQTLDRAHRAIQQAARLRAPHVSLGLHGIPAKKIAPSDSPGYAALDDATADAIVSGLRELVVAAEGSDVNLTLEMHEHSVLHSSVGMLRVLDAVGSDRVTANPDLGNLLRATGELAEEPLETLERLAGRVGYWHVKNGVRLEVGPGAYRMFPVEMSQGTMNYRALLRTALASGHDAPLVVEHYGGDVLNQARAGAAYLRQVLAELAAERLGDS